MRVLYDISILGNGLRYNSCRTGSFRAVEETLLSLARLNECELSLTAGQVDGSRFERFTNYQYSLSYWQHHSQLQKIPFPHKPACGQLNDFIAAAGLEHKARTRQLIYALSMQWMNDCGQNSLSTPDIYHQTTFPLPNFKFTTNRTSRVTTVFDMTPALFPHFYRESAVICSRFKRFMASLNPKDWVICCSESTRSDFLQLSNHPADRVKVIYCAADSSLFHPCTDETLISTTRKKYNIPQGRYILSLGALEPRKNLHSTISAFAQLVDNNSTEDVTLVLVGPEVWLDSSVSSLLLSEKLQRRIVATGFVNDADLSPLYSGAEFLVYPSLYEGFGLPVLEAMQCGTPVITSNNSSLPEVAGDAGLLIEPTDVSDLASKMLRLCTDADLRKKLSQSALAQSKTFSWDRAARQTMELYRQATRE